MGEVQTNLEFLIDLPLYQTEKPYMIQPSVEDKLDPSDPKLHNIEWELRPVVVRDIRGSIPLPIETTGFSMINHISQKTSFANVFGKEEYRQETAQCLKKMLGAEAVQCYDCRVCFG